MFKWVSDPDLLLAGLVLSLLQCLAALPALWSIDPKGFREALRSPQKLGSAALLVLGLGVALAAFIGYFGDSDGLRSYGRWYAALLHVQLIGAFIILVPRAFTLLLPKTGAVAFAAYRESLRSMIFHAIVAGAAILMLVAVVIPYYTFGDDYKMMKMMGFDIIMLASALFGILAAALNISEEIEGRTAITVISKPINRRSFLLGKYFGILMACFTLTLILSWLLNWTLILNAAQEKIVEVEDKLTEQAQHDVAPLINGLLGRATGTFGNGVIAWTGDSIGNGIGVARGFGQVMILVAIATALATRLPFVINILVTMVLFFLGNLAPVVVKATDKPESGNSVAIGLIRFFGKLFDTLLPALEHFQMNTVVVRETPIDLWQLGGFVLTVLVYSVVYTTVVLLIGLLLFENRDLA